MTDDYLLDDLERSQLNATTRRRRKRSRRYYQFLLLALGFLALIVLAAPSLVSHTGTARSMLASSAQAYGWKATAQSINVGWITPLSIRNLELVGDSGETTIRIERVDTALTVTDLIGFDPAVIGEVSIRGVDLACSVSEGRSSIESDLAKLMAPVPDDPESTVRATIQIQDAGATVTDSTTGASWLLKQSNLNVSIDGLRINGDIAGVVNQPNGDGGAFQSQFVWHPMIPASKIDSPVAASQVSRSASESVWELTIETESFPLSVTDLVSRRFTGQMEGLPEQFSGDTTGRLQLVGSVDGAVHANLGDVQIRNLKMVTGQTAGQSQGEVVGGKSIKQWNNGLASLDGKLEISGGWLIGQGLEISTDFASATLDGSFPTTISLFGSNDNLRNWLKALDGKARVDIDLAALDQSLPGLIPLRRNATIVSGKARGIIENTSDAGQNGQSDPGLPTTRRCRLTLESDALRARSDGRMVVVDPIKLSATVTDDHGSLRAERFDLSSSFAQASGSGTLQDGKAEVEFDFGRLYAMFRPVIDLSDLSLGGTADGKLHWTVQRAGDDGADQWDMGGTCEARNLLVSLPGGHRFKRSIVQGDISAKGQWTGKTLKQLTSADVGLRSGGVSLRAELTQPVANPTADSVFPIHLQTDGRLENLNESLRPWLPESLLSAEGRLTGSATAKVSRSGGSLSKADFILNQPRINYDNRWYVQPSLTVRFTGNVDWPSGVFSTQDMTVVGESISLRILGEASREKTDLDVVWKADLEGLQQSVGSTIARAASTKLMRPISYRPVSRNSYRFIGISDGRLKITGGPIDWIIDATASVSDLAVRGPTDSRNLPPGMVRGGFESSQRATFGATLGQSQDQAVGQLLWSEPRVKVDGTVAYNTETGTVKLPELQVASDWFAGTLRGEIRSDGPMMSAQLKGPARWKMDLVAQRLSQLLGTTVRATGIHEGPIELGMTSSATQSMAIFAKGDLGWDECEVAGIRLGRSTIPFETTSQKTKIAQTTIPILSTDASSQDGSTEAGLATFAAEISYAVSPSKIRLSPGSKVQSLRITPSTASNWLKYLTPLAAGATTINGTVSAEFDEALFVIDDPDASVVRGSLDIQELRLSSGPLVNQLIQGVDQVKSIARLTGGQAEPQNAKKWVEMPPQSVDFSFENGVATHQRMYFKIDRASLMTSGHVATNSQIDLVALVPLDARWLGNDLKGLAGQTLTFPITGTLSRPTLDDSAIRRVMTEIGTKAGAAVIQNQLDGLIQKQLGSGIEQINSGLEKIFPF